MDFKVTPEELLAPIEFDQQLVPPLAMPVLYLKGAFREMGRQYGRQLSAMIRRNTAVAIADAILAVGTVEQTAEKLQIYVDITLKSAPDIIELWRGIAEGAGLRFMQVALLNSKLTMMAGPTMCSGIAAWGGATRDRKMIHACNVDTVTSDGYYGAVLHLYPEQGNQVLTTVNLAGKLCGGVTLNQHGLCMNMTGSQAARPIDHKAGYDPIGSMMYVLLYSDTLEQAIRNYIDLHVFSAGTVLLSQGQEAVIIEHSCAADVVRRAGDYGESDFIHTTNHFLSPELQPALYTDPPIRHSNARYDGEELVLREQLGTLTPESVLDILGMLDYWDGERWAKNAWDANADEEEICLSSPNMRSIHYKTNSSFACLPESGTVYIITGAADLNAGLLPRGTHVPFAITLKATPQDSVMAAEEATYIRLWESAKTLSGKAGKNAGLLALAKEQMWHGVSCRAAAVLAPDETRALELYGKAASCFMESQSYAGAARIDRELPW